MYKSYAPLPIMHYTVKDYAKRKFPNGKISANEKAIKQLVTWKRSSVMLSICALVLSLFLGLWHGFSYSKYKQ